MSINRDMEKYMLQKNNPIRSYSGANKENWEDVDEVDAAVYKKNDLKVVASEKYLESSHTGLTHCKALSAQNYRLIKDSKVYEILECNTEGRLTNLLLKVVEGYA